MCINKQETNTKQIDYSVKSRTIFSGPAKISECSGVEFLFLTWPIFHESFLLTPGFFPLKTKKYLHRHPVDS